MKKFLKGIPNELIWSVIIVIGCRADTDKPDTKVYEPGDETATGDGYPLIPEAIAAPIDAGSPNQIMPENPAQISLRFEKKSPKLMVALLSGNPMPYKFDVFDTGEELVLTLYIPKDQELPIAISPADEDGDQIGSSSKIYYLRPNAKLGSTKVDLEGTPEIISFHDGAQVLLELGNNAMLKDPTMEFMDGGLQTLRHGSFTPDRDLTCRVSWSGAQHVYMFTDEEPECMAEPFEVALRTAQEMCVYPVDQGNPEGISIHIEELD